MKDEIIVFTEYQGRVIKQFTQIKSDQEDDRILIYLEDGGCVEVNVNEVILEVKTIPPPLVPALVVEGDEAPSGGGGEGVDNTLPPMLCLTHADNQPLLKRSTWQARL